MRPLDAALRYAARGWPVFPCRSAEPHRKRPLVANGFYAATGEPAKIRAWWAAWSDALIGVPTGAVTGFVALDIDVKNDLANGLDTLEDLGRAILPDTPMVHTPSGGVHVYFAASDRELRNSAGVLGAGLDVRGDGGYIIVPSPGSGYSWDPILNFRTTPLAPAPEWLWPPKVSRPAFTGPIVAVEGLSRYGERAIDLACDAIVSAPAGQQERVLNAEAYSIGTAVGAGLGLPADIALRALLRAASAMPDHDAQWPWRPEEIDLKVRRAFRDGVAHPREVRRAVA